MFSFNNNDIAILTVMCVANLFCAAVVHRAVLFNAGFMQRRLLFEGLGLFGYLVAICLSLFGLLMWVRNPPFVIACSVLWVILCSLIVFHIWRSHHKRVTKKILEVPEFWDLDASDGNQQTIMAGRNTDKLASVLTGRPEFAQNSPATTVHRSRRRAEVPETAVHADEPDLSGNEVRDKLEKYTRKRAYKSAAISNLAAYRERIRKTAPESAIRTACK